MRSVKAHYLADLVTSRHSCVSIKPTPERIYTTAHSAVQVSTGSTDAGRELRATVKLYGIPWQSLAFRRFR